MSIALQAPAYIRAISPYIPGKPITELARQMGIPVEKIVKLASNENPLGMSPKARKAVETALAGVERYPDQFELIAALAERHGVSPGQITLGNGSNDVLDLAARVFLAPGRSAVSSPIAHCVRLVPPPTVTPPVPAGVSADGVPPPPPPPVPHMAEAASDGARTGIPGTASFAASPLASPHPMSHVKAVAAPELPTATRSTPWHGCKRPSMRRGRPP